MAFWSDYRKSLKPLAVEEPVDRWVHRPLAYVLARLCRPLRWVSPNGLTILSILCGLATGALIVTPGPWHLQLAALTLFTATIFDCADGQLARMRGTSSTFGRMLDGLADGLVAIATVGGLTYLMWQRWHDPWWVGVLVVLVCLATIVTGSQQNGSFDHYKNVYLQLTTPDYKDAEAYAIAEARHAARIAGKGLGARTFWRIYLSYVRGQTKLTAGFDPVFGDLGKVPRYTPERAKIYAELGGPVMRLWKGWLGFGSLMFGLTLALALELPELYILARITLLSALYFGHVRPAQRTASARAAEAFAKQEQTADAGGA